LPDLSDLSWRIGKARFINDRPRLGCDEGSGNMRMGLGEGGGHMIGNMISRKNSTELVP
jgi:hypothetical protein